MSGYLIVSALVFLTCILLILVVLVQNPKGGGLSSAFGGSSSSNQIMGVKRTTDFLEKTTWTLAIILLVLSLSSVFVIPRSQNVETEKSEAKEFYDNNPNAAINVDPEQVVKQPQKQQQKKGESRDQLPGQGEEE